MSARTKEAKMPSSRDSRFSGVSFSKIFPRFITMTRSAVKIVWTRCCGKTKAYRNSHYNNNFHLRPDPVPIKVNGRSSIVFCRFWIRPYSATLIPRDLKGLYEPWPWAWKYICRCLTFRMWDAPLTSIGLLRCVKLSMFMSVCKIEPYGAWCWTAPEGFGIYSVLIDSGNSQHPPWLGSMELAIRN